MPRSFWRVGLLGAAVSTLSGERPELLEAQRLVDLARNIEPTGSEWRGRLPDPHDLDAATAALGTAEAELQAMEAAWRAERPCRLCGGRPRARCARPKRLAPTVGPSARLPAGRPRFWRRCRASMGWWSRRGAGRPLGRPTWTSAHTDPMDKRLTQTCTRAMITRGTNALAMASPRGLVDFVCQAARPRGSNDISNTGRTSCKAFGWACDGYCAQCKCARAPAAVYAANPAERLPRGLSEMRREALSSRRNFVLGALVGGLPEPFAWASANRTHPRGPGRPLLL